MKCIFCEYAKGGIIHDRVVFEDDLVLAFYEEKHPQAPFHVLLIPKVHIESGFDITFRNSKYIGRIFEAAAIIARRNHLVGV